MFESQFYFDVRIIKGIINKGAWIKKRERDVRGLRLCVQEKRSGEFGGRGKGK